MFDDTFNFHFTIRKINIHDTRGKRKRKKKENNNKIKNESIFLGKNHSRQDQKILSQTLHIYYKTILTPFKIFHYIKGEGYFKNGKGCGEDGNV